MIGQKAPSVITPVIFTNLKEGGSVRIAKEKVNAGEDAVEVTL